MLTVFPLFFSDCDRTASAERNSVHVRPGREHPVAARYTSAAAGSTVGSGPNIHHSLGLAATVPAVRIHSSYSQHLPGPSDTAEVQ